MRLGVAREGQARTPPTEALFQTAARLAASGRTAEAIAFFEQIVSANPGNAVAHHNLAVAYLEVGRLKSAVVGFRHAIALKPTYADAHFRLGQALEQLGQSGEAIAAYGRAVDIKPRMASAHQRLGDLFRLQGDPADAVRAYRRAAAAAPDTTLGRLSRARVHIAEGEPDQAEACLRRALVHDPADAALHWLLATVLGEAGRFDEAEASFRRTIALAPDRVEVYRDFLLTKKLRPSDRPLLTQLVDRVEKDAARGISPRTEVLFAIAKGHDDLGEYESAMRRFEEGNAIRRKTAVFNRDEQARWVDHLMAAFTAELSQRASDLGHPDARPVFIVGMPRSGTTLVEQIISNHRNIAGGGELSFWPSRGRALDRADLAGNAVSGLAALARDFRAEMDRISPSAARITDKNPYNFDWVGLIRLAFPNARFIHCSRHPVDTALSIYTTLFGTRADYACNRGDLVFYYRQYQRLMRHWRDVLPAGAIFEAPYEAIVSDPDAWSRALIDFCGLDWDDACLRPEANPRVVRTASLWQARQPVYTASVERWRRYEPWLGELRDLLGVDEAGPC
jgi:tetratricopeptide (TPR) repeat protein